jgi:hypothetical protein
MQLLHLDSHVKTYVNFTEPRAVLDSVCFFGMFGKLHII